MERPRFKSNLLIQGGEVVCFSPLTMGSRDEAGSAGAGASGWGCFSPLAMGSRDEAGHIEESGVTDRGGFSPLAMGSRDEATFRRLLLICPCCFSPLAMGSRDEAMLVQLEELLDAFQSPSDGK